jgi:phosphatidate cytidylyltransferase
MKRVLTAVTLIPLVLLVVLRAPLWLFTIAVAVVVILALREFLHMAKAYGLDPVEPAVYAIAALIIFTQFAASTQSVVPLAYSSVWSQVSFPLSSLILLLPIFFGAPFVFRRDLRFGLASVAVSFFGVAYIAMSLSLLIALRADVFHNILVLFVLFCVWAGDTAAYYVGRAVGRHKLAPLVSPGKTWEGAIASLIASVAVALLVMYFREPLGKSFSSYWNSQPPPQIHVPAAHIIGLGIVTNMAGQFGDLFESALKRGAQVKDSGSLLPGHGGVLDRIDALLFAIPAVWYYAMLTHLLRPPVF